LASARAIRVKAAVRYAQRLTKHQASVARLGATRMNFTLRRTPCASRTAGVSVIATAWAAEAVSGLGCLDCLSPHWFTAKELRDGFGAIGVEVDFAPRATAGARMQAEATKRAPVVKLSGFVAQ
jgi:hypothetical protein